MRQQSKLWKFIGSSGTIFARRTGMFLSSTEEVSRRKMQKSFSMQKISMARLLAGLLWMLPVSPELWHSDIDLMGYGVIDLLLPIEYRYVNDVRAFLCTPLYLKTNSK